MLCRNRTWATKQEISAGLHIILHTTYALRKAKNAQAAQEAHIALLEDQMVSLDAKVRRAKINMVTTLHCSFKAAGKAASHGDVDNHACSDEQLLVWRAMAAVPTSVVNVIADKAFGLHCNQQAIKAMVEFGSMWSNEQHATRCLSQEGIIRISRSLCVSEVRKVSMPTCSAAAADTKAAKKLTSQDIQKHHADLN